MNEENNQNAPILGLNGGGGGGMLPMSDFPSGTYKIKFSDEYYQGDNHTNKLIKGRIVLLQNDDVNDGNYFVGNRMIYDDAFVDEVVSYVSNFDVNYYIPSLGGDFMNEHSAIMYNDIILDYEMVGGMFNPTNEYHFVLDEEWYNKHYGDDSNKVLRTLATGQSDITRHEAYTKAQGLNWANANVPNYVAADKFNGHEYVDLGLPSGTLWAKYNVGASSETDSGLYFAWGETEGYTAEQVGVDKQFSWADYKFNPSGDGETFTKYTSGLETLELVDDAAAVNMGGNWHMPSEALILELLVCTTHGFIDTTGQFTKFIQYSNSPIYLPSDDSTESTTTFNGVAGYIFFRDGKSLSESISNGEYIFIPVNHSAFNGSLSYGGDIEYEVMFYSNFIDVDLPLSFIFSKLPAGTGLNGRDITSSCSIASPRFVGNPVRGVIGQLESQGGNEGGNRGGTSR